MPTLTVDTFTDMCEAQATDSEGLMNNAVWATSAMPRLKTRRAVRSRSHSGVAIVVAARRPSHPYLASTANITAYMAMQASSRVRLNVWRVIDQTARLHRVDNATHFAVSDWPVFIRQCGGLAGTYIPDRACLSPAPVASGCPQERREARLTSTNVMKALASTVCATMASR